MTRNLKFKDNYPIYKQIVEDITLDIIKGNIKLGSKMLSVRELAIEYKVNPNTIQNVVRELENKNVIEIKKNIGIYVKSDLIITDLKKEVIDEYVIDMIDNVKKLGFSKEELIKKTEELWRI